MALGQFPRTDLSNVCWSCRLRLERQSSCVQPSQQQAYKRSYRSVVRRTKYEPKQPDWPQKTKKKSKSYNYSFLESLTSGHLESSTQGPKTGPGIGEGFFGNGKASATSGTASLLGKWTGSVQRGIIVRKYLHKPRITASLVYPAWFKEIPPGLIAGCAEKDSYEALTTDELELLRRLDFDGDTAYLPNDQSISTLELKNGFLKEFFRRMRLSSAVDLDGVKRALTYIREPSERKTEPLAMEREETLFDDIKHIFQMSEKRGLNRSIDRSLDMLMRSNLTSATGPTSHQNPTENHNLLSDLTESLKKHLRPSMSRPMLLHESVARIRCVSQSRSFSTKVGRLQAQVLDDVKEGTPVPPPSPDKASSIRDNLQMWQTEHDREQERNHTALGLQSKIDTSWAQATIVQSWERDRAAELNNDTESELNLEGFEDSDNHSLMAEQHLQPGALAELVCAGGSVLAVLMRRFENQSQFYTASGRWMHRAHQKQFFAIQGFASASEVESILPYLPQEEVPRAQLDLLGGLSLDVPRTIGGPLVTRMNEFINEANEAYRVNAHILDKAHDIMAKDKHPYLVHIDEIARRLLNRAAGIELSNATLWAIHRAVTGDPMGFRVRDYGSYWKSGILEVVPHEDVAVAKQVQTWMREHQEYVIARLGSGPSEPQTSVLAEFAKKARAVIQESRKHRAITPYGGIGPYTQKSPKGENVGVPRSIVLSRTEPAHALILRFMELWCARHYIHSSPLSAIGPMVLKATGMYEELDVDLDKLVGFTFLQEMGVISPWDSLIAFDSSLALPINPPELVKDGLLKQAKESSEKWVPLDVFKGLRRDWAEIEVFCIDSASAQEIDDGISLEPVAGDDTCVWIHVHIANPSALLQPDHPMALYAAHRVTSAYLPEKSFPMLPSKIVQEHFSLSKGRPTLSFSAKLSNDGKILEHRITPGTIQNVTYTTPEFVNQTISPDEDNDVQAMKVAVGRAGPLAKPGLSRKLTSKLSPSQVKAMERLYTLSQARLRKRLEKGCENLFSFQTGTEPKLHHVQLEQPWRRAIRRIEGDPAVEIEGHSFDPHPLVGSKVSDDAKMIVEEMMIVACEVAGLWCSQRNLPVLYRSTLADASQPSAAAFRDEVLMPEREKTGHISRLHNWKYVTLSGTAITTTYPRTHSYLGIDTYTRVTSPLRRYSDMFAHWQIQAALLQEAKLGRPVSKEDQIDLPFTSEETSRVLQNVDMRERCINKAMRDSKRHWIFQAIFRAHYFGEHPLPAEWRAMVFKAGPEEFKVVLCDLGIWCSVKFPKDSGIKPEDLKLEEVWMVKILHINLLYRRMTVAPVRRGEGREGDL